MPRYWFRQKSFGYGATPNTWQGWALTVISLVLVFAAVMIGPTIRDNMWRALWMIGALAVIAIPSFWVAHRKTEGGWRWRNGDNL